MLRTPGCAPKPCAERFSDDRRAGRVGGTTAVFRASMKRFLFLKESFLLHGDRPLRMIGYAGFFIHVGSTLTPGCLRALWHKAHSPIGNLEGLEQLRFLEQPGLSYV